MRAVQKSWPELTDVLGEQFEILFSRYAASAPVNAADGAAFLRFVWKHLADPQARLRLCAVRASIGFPLRMVVNRAGIAVSVRIPARGIRGWIWRLGRL